MPTMRQFRDPELSLWMSAVDQYLAGSQAGGQLLTADSPQVLARPDVSNPMLADATEFCASQEQNLPFPQTTPEGEPRLLGIGDTVTRCSSIAWDLIKAKITGNQEKIKEYEQLLSPFGSCDPGYAECVKQYLKFFELRNGKIPYRTNQYPDRYVIDNILPDNATVALVGDWGTGQQAARRVLEQVARKNPHVVIHLGDIYYSGTDFEVDHYFHALWTSILDLSRTRTYTLSGNHDMYCGGGPYYRLIDQLGQPASYFNLRNAKWQLLALDTGFNDHNPAHSEFTRLQDSEVSWVEHQIASADGRRSILLSHHQLFSAKEDICGQAVNTALEGQLASLFSGVTRWFWAHEHDMVIYKPWSGVTARCVGCGAFPVGADEIAATPKHPQIPMENVKLPLAGALYENGYAILRFAGDAATAEYYQTGNENAPLWQESF